MTAVLIIGSKGGGLAAGIILYRQIGRCGRPTTTTLGDIGLVAQNDVHKFELEKPNHSRFCPT